MRLREGARYWSRVRIMMEIIGSSFRLSRQVSSQSQGGPIESNMLRNYIVRAVRRTGHSVSRSTRTKLAADTVASN
jgi:hypothetical protein